MFILEQHQIQLGIKATILFINYFLYNLKFFILLYYFIF